MIDFMHHFHFIRPAALLLLPVVLGVWLVWRRRADPLRGWRAQMDAELLDALVIGEAGRGDRGAWPLAAWILAAVAIAGPTWRLEPNPLVADAPPLLVLLKAAETMNATDLSPTRLKRAELKIVDLAKVRTGQPLGLIAYAGSAHLVLPPTRDTDAVAEMATEISSDVMPTPGDRLDLAISQAEQVLSGADPPVGGSLLVIADSVDLSAEAVAAAHKSGGSPPIQFLSFAAPDSSQDQSIRDVASRVGASVVALTPDDQDVTEVVQAAERRTAVAIAGDSGRWEESGYWLTLPLALIVAVSFRRRQIAAELSS